MALFERTGDRESVLDPRSPRSLSAVTAHRVSFRPTPTSSASSTETRLFVHGLLASPLLATVSRKPCRTCVFVSVLPWQTIARIVCGLYGVPFVFPSSVPRLLATIAHRGLPVGANGLECLMSNKLCCTGASSSLDADFVSVTCSLVGARIFIVAVR